MKDKASKAGIMRPIKSTDSKFSTWNLFFSVMHVPGQHNIYPMAGTTGTWDLQHQVWGVQLLLHLLILSKQGMQHQCLSDIKFLASWLATNTENFMYYLVQGFEFQLWHWWNTKERDTATRQPSFSSTTLHVKLVVLNRKTHLEGCKWNPMMQDTPGQARRRWQYTCKKEGRYFLFG